MRRFAIKIKQKKYASTWPIMPQAAAKPQPWHGWPGQKRFALVLTHDVETDLGQKNSTPLFELEKHLGFCSSFNFVPLRYEVSKTLIAKLKDNGFEVGVHGLHHDGKLFQSRSVFDTRAQQINYYLNDWQAVGFRAPAMQHNLSWMHVLNIDYDLSTFDTDPFEPQPDGVHTIFPFIVKNKDETKSYVEMPYTLPQDFTLYVLMGQTNPDIWKRKLDWIAENQGMALLNTHPDYISFPHQKGIKNENYSAQIYQEFLEYVATQYSGQYVNVLPREMAEFWMRTYCPLFL